MKVTRVSSRTVNSLFRNLHHSMCGQFRVYLIGGQIEIENADVGNPIQDTV